MKEFEFEYNGKKLTITKEILTALIDNTICSIESEGIFYVEDDILDKFLTDYNLYWD